jgi:hypothetical protein
MRSGPRMEHYFRANFLKAGNFELAGEERPVRNSLSAFRLPAEKLEILL